MNSQPRTATLIRACPRCPRCRSYVLNLIVASRFHAEGDDALSEQASSFTP